MRMKNTNPNPISYIHLRVYDDEGKPMNQGGCTIAYRDSHEQPGKLEVAFARCRYSDNFNRKIGRAIAAGHLKFYSLYHIDADNDPAKQYEKIVDFVLDKLDSAVTLHEVQMEAQQATIN